MFALVHTPADSPLWLFHFDLHFVILSGHDGQAQARFVKRDKSRINLTSSKPIEG